MSREVFTEGCWVVDEVTGDSGVIDRISGGQALVRFGRRSHADEWVPLADLSLAAEQPA